MMEVIMTIRALGVVLVLLLTSAGAASADELGELTRDLASDPELEVRLRSVVRLTKIDDPRSLAACIRAVGHDSAAVVRGAAADCLRKLVTATTATADLARVRRALFAAIGDPDRAVRKHAARASTYLQTLTPPAAPCVPPPNRLAPNPCSAVPSQAAAATTKP
jgi:HEAT repeat protein